MSVGTAVGSSVSISSGASGGASYMWVSSAATVGSGIVVAAGASAWQATSKMINRINTKNARFFMRLLRLLFSESFQITLVQGCYSVF
jgi:hypothetical protein